jgi:hypothetical protein
MESMESMGSMVSMESMGSMGEATSNTRGDVYLYLCLLSTL